MWEQLQGVPPDPTMTIKQVLNHLGAELRSRCLAVVEQNEIIARPFYLPEGEPRYHPLGLPPHRSSFPSVRLARIHQAYILSVSVKMVRGATAIRRDCYPTRNDVLGTIDVAAAYRVGSRLKFRSLSCLPGLRSIPPADSPATSPTSTTPLPFWSLKARNR